MTKEDTQKNTGFKRRFQGVVTSNKMDKTIVVKIDHVRTHRLYKKRFTVSKKYKVHDERNQYKPGDVVEFVETRPISKDKKWRVVYTNEQ